MHPEGPATGHLDTGFLGFPLSLSKCRVGSQIPSCYCMLLMQPSLSKFIKITPCSGATKLINFQIISTLSNESWNKILPSLSQAFTTHHPNVFTPILSLSEGRAGIAWVPSNNMLFFPLRYNRLQRVRGCSQRSGWSNSPLGASLHVLTIDVVRQPVALLTVGSVHSDSWSVSVSYEAI
jgi:hypothetical protein